MLLTGPLRLLRLGVHSSKFPRGVVYRTVAV